MPLANRAGGIVVGKFGTATVSYEELFCMTRIVVTGAAGFIGSNIVKGLNARGIDDIIAVDDLTQGDKFRNLADLQIADYVDADEFYDRLRRRRLRQGRGGVPRRRLQRHDGDRRQVHDGQQLHAVVRAVRRLPASAARGCCTPRRPRPTAARTPSASRPSSSSRSTSTATASCCSTSACGASCGARLQATPKRQVAGFRYFNVYGPREQHKGRMASVAFHQFNQFRAEGKVKLFGEYGGYGPGEQKRDFVFIDDVVAVNLWFFDHPDKSGIFNLGTRPRPAVQRRGHRRGQRLRAAGQPMDTAGAARRGLIEYMPFPTRCAASTSATPRPTCARCARPAATTPSPTCRRAWRSYMRRWLSGQHRPEPERSTVAGSRRPFVKQELARSGSTTSRRYPMLKKILAVMAMLYAAAALAAVDVNKATAAELDGIKGIGPGTSKHDHGRAQEGRLQGLGRLHRARQGRGRRRAAKLSAEGLTVNGAAYKEADAKKEDKKDAKADKKEEKKEEKKAEKKEDKKDEKAAAAKPAASAKK